MATGKVLNVIEENFFEVEITRYSAGTIKRANGLRLDQDRSSSIISQYGFWLDQKRTRLNAVAAEKVSLQTLINQEKPKPIKSVDPLNPPTEPDDYYQNEGAMAFAESRISALDAMEADLKQAIHAFEGIRSREVLRRDSFRLDADRLDATLESVWVENIWARDCSPIGAGDVVLVISLDFEGKQLVLDPDPIGSDYLANLNQAWWNYAVSVRNAAALGNQIEVLRAWLASELAKPEMPPFPHQNPDTLRALEVDLVNTQKGIQYRESLLKSYQQKLADDPDSPLAGDWQTAINTLESEILTLQGQLETIELDLENQKALPKAQVGQYQDSALIQDFQNQIATAEGQVGDAHSQKDQAATALAAAKDAALARASDTIRSGFRSFNQLNALTGAQSQTPAQWFSNAALVYGAQKWNPFFITGDVTESGGTITVTPDEVIRSVGGREIDVTPLGLKTPVTLSADGFEYEVGDKALLKINNVQSAALQSFGWAFGARPCSVDWPAGFFNSASALPVDNDYFEYAPNISRPYFENAYLTMDGRFSWREDSPYSFDSIWRLYDLDTDTGFYIYWPGLVVQTVRDLPEYYADAPDASILNPSSKSGFFCRIATKYKDSGAYADEIRNCEMWYPPVRAFDYYYLSVTFPETPGECLVSMQFLGGWDDSYSSGDYPTIQADYTWVDSQLLYGFGVSIYPLSKTKSVLIKSYSTQARGVCATEYGFYSGSYARKKEAIIFEHATGFETLAWSEMHGSESVSAPDGETLIDYGKELIADTIKTNRFRIIIVEYIPDYDYPEQTQTGYLMDELGNILDSNGIGSKYFRYWRRFHGKYVIDFGANTPSSTVKMTVYDLIGRFITELPNTGFPLYSFPTSFGKGYGFAGGRLFKVAPDGLSLVADTADFNAYGGTANLNAFRGWIYKLKNP